MPIAWISPTSTATVDVREIAGSVPPGAAFEVHGYTFTGNVAWNPGLVTGACGTNCDGIYGKFVRFVTLDADFVMGPPTSYGTTVVELRE